MVLILSSKVTTSCKKKERQKQSKYKNHNCISKTNYYRLRSKHFSFSLSSSCIVSGEYDEISGTCISECSILIDSVEAHIGARNLTECPLAAAETILVNADILDNI